MWGLYTVGYMRSFHRRTLCADVRVALNHHDDLTEQDKAIKAELAYDIAKQLLEEDLIHVESDDILE